MSLLLLFPVSGPRALVIDASAASFTLTGQNATLARSVVLSADSASFTLSGQNATTSYGRALNLDSGSFAESGQDASFTRTFLPLNAASGSFDLTGQDVNFGRTFAARELNAEIGSFDILGQSATFLRSRIFNAESATEGSYFESGYADPTYVEGIGYQVDGQTYQSGDYVSPDYVYGNGATLAYSRSFGVNSTSILISGQDATLLKTSVFPAPEDVRVGIAYGPNGIYVGTLQASAAQATLKYWNGSQWVDAGMKVWNGSTWV